MDRERSTAYRSVRRPLQTGTIEKERIDCDRGGYYRVYSPSDSAAVTGDTRLLNDRYARPGQLIAEFESEYERSEPAAAAES